MKILINHKKLVQDNTWQDYRKVRAVIENEEGCFAISSEAGKYIFPGGKCDEGEEDIVAIQREIKEEMGIELSLDEFEKVLELETLYDDAVDFRTGLIRPRHTITTYYYVKTNQSINPSNMNLTEGEIKENFKISFVNKDKLLEMLSIKNEEAMNWHLFYEENQVVVENIINKL